MSPIDVHVMSEKSSEYDTVNTACADRTLRERANEREHQHAAHVHRDPLNAGGESESEERADDRPVGPPAAPRGNDTTQPPFQSL